MQLPPMCSARSMTATRLPKYAACAPPFSPAGPQPITIKSKVSLEVTNSSAESTGPGQLSISPRIVGEEDMRARKFLAEVCWVAPSQKSAPLEVRERAGEKFW